MAQDPSRVRIVIELRVVLMRIKVIGLALMLPSLAGLWSPRSQSPSTVAIDGMLAPGELAGASTFKLSNGGSVHLRRLEDHIYVAIQSPEALL